MDSLRGQGTEHHETIFQYLKDEHKDKMKADLPNAEDWTLEPCHDTIPRQRNGYDCGAYVCRYLNRLARDLPLDFDQQDMSNFRRQVALSILDNEVWE